MFRRVCLVAIMVEFISYRYLMSASLQIGGPCSLGDLAIVTR